MPSNSTHEIVSAPWHDAGSRRHGIINWATIVGNPEKIIVIRATEDPSAFADEPELGPLDKAALRIGYSEKTTSIG